MKYYVSIVASYMFICTYTSKWTSFCSYVYVYMCYTYTTDIYTLTNMTVVVAIDLYYMWNYHTVTVGLACVYNLILRPHP